MPNIRHRARPLEGAGLTRAVFGHPSSRTVAKFGPVELIEGRRAAKLDSRTSGICSDHGVQALRVPPVHVKTERCLGQRLDAPACEPTLRAATRLGWAGRSSSLVADQPLRAMVLTYLRSTDKWLRDNRRPGRSRLRTANEARRKKRVNVTNATGDGACNWFGSRLACDIIPTGLPRPTCLWGVIA